MDLGLAGKSAVVGGASQGIGFAIARLLALEGATVAIVARRQDRLDAAASRIAEESGRRVLAIPADIRKAADCERIIERTVAELGGLDILVNNDGAPPLGPLAEFDDAAWDKAVQQNLMSVVRLTRRAVPVMRSRGGGRIVNITALSVLQPRANFGLSIATWAGVLGYAKTLSLEVAADRITVNTLCPGRIATGRIATAGAARPAALGRPARALRRLGALAGSSGGDPRRRVEPGRNFVQERAQPRDVGPRAEPRVPQHGDLERGAIVRWRDQGQGIDAGEPRRQPPRHHGDQIGVGQHARRRQEMRHRDVVAPAEPMLRQHLVDTATVARDDAALEPVLRHEAVDHLGDVAGQRNREMRQARDHIERQRRARRRMIRAQHPHHLVPIKRGMGEALGDAPERTDQQIHAAGVELFDDIDVVDRPHAQLGERRVGAQARSDLGQQQGREIVGGTARSVACPRRRARTARPRACSAAG